MTGGPSVDEAEGLARELLAPLGDRWKHTIGVGHRAEELAGAVDEEDRDLLVVAAWWHDLGYAPGLADTGCHQLDGARYLAAEGYPDRLCALVAHHSAATFEAEERGLLNELNVWHREEGPVADALATADMTTDPKGRPVVYPGRLAEILDRYESSSVVARAMKRARPDIEAAISRTEARLRDSGFRALG